MQFFRNLLGSKVLPLPFSGDRELQAAFTELRKGKTKSTQQLLAHPDPNARYFYAFELGSVVTRELVESWCQSQPDCQEAVFLRAAQGPQWAWQARTAQVAALVNSDRRAEFSRRLNFVRQDLEGLIQRNPKDPNPHALLLIVAKGEDRPASERQAIWKQMFELYPNHYAGNRNYLDSILAKWGGSYQQTMEFTRQVMEACPEGSEIGVLTLVALTEHWLYLDAFEKQPEQASQFVQESASHSLAAQAYQRSIGSDLFQFGVSSINACNEAAFWFYLSQQPQYLKRELTRIGDRCTASPWDYLGPVSVIFEKARKFARSS